MPTQPNPALESIKRDVISRWEKEIPKVSRFVCALYRADENDEPEQFGSGFFLKVGPRYFLVTAAHILDENEGGKTIYVAAPASGGLEELVGPSFRSNASGGRSLDKIDFGVVEILGPLLDNIGKANFAPVEQLDVDDIGKPGALYFAMGYPATKNKLKRNPARTFKRSLFTYLAHLLPPAKLKLLGLTPASHLLISFDKKKAFTGQSNEKVTPPDPHGVSGGPLWKFDPYRKKEPLSKIVGVMIEYHRQIKGMLAVRTPFLVAGLSHKYPDLIPFLPKTKSVRVTITEAATPQA